MQDLEATDAPSTRSAVYRALSASTLIVPFWDEVGAAHGLHQPLTVAIGDSDEPCLPAFSDWAAVERWSNRSAPRSYASLRAPGVFIVAERLRLQWVWVNLGGPSSLRVNRAAIAILAKGGVPTGFEPDGSQAPA